MIKTFEAGGKTVEEAIDSALLLANTTIENVDIEVLELGGRGVFGFGKKDARVRISLEVEDEKPAKKAPDKDTRPPKQPKPKAAENPEDEAPVVKEMIRARAEEPAKPGRDRGRNRNRTQAVPARAQESAENVESSENNTAKAAPRGEHHGYRVSEGEEAERLTAEAMAFLTPIFQSLKVEPQQETVVKEGILWLVFSGQGLGSLIGRRGETLNALQYLTNLSVNREKKEHVRLVLDVQGYRAGREETLVALAKKMADKAVRSGRRVELEPMNPHERRIVHIALQNDKRVDTMSQGEEPYRHVVINRRRGEHNHGNGNQNQQRRKPTGGKSEGKSEEKLSLSQQLGQQFSEQMENR